MPGRPGTRDAPCPQGCGFQDFPGTVARHANTCLTPLTIERLYEIGKVDVGGDGCWEWGRGAYAARREYGVVRGKYAHQWAYEIAHGSRGGLHVLHRCDNPPCIRSDHLYLGTQGQNIQDSWDRTRRR